jgi:hypothetical protein
MSKAASSFVGLDDAPPAAMDAPAKVEVAYEYDAFIFYGRRDAAAPSTRLGGRLCREPVLP